MASQQRQKSSGFFARLFGAEKVATSKVPEIATETLLRLNELCARHTFVDVRFMGRDDISYQSLIIDVDAKTRSLRIDELYPLDRRMNVVVGEEIEIVSRGKGVPVKFVSTISALEIFDGAPAYRVALPTKIKANQRRGFFRLDVNRDMDIRLHIPLETGGLGFCTILNISSSGIGFRFDKNITDQIKASHVMKEAKLTLPGNITMYCDLEVRSYDYKKSPDRFTMIGARIINLSAAEQKQFDKFLVQFQREAKRSAD